LFFAIVNRVNSIRKFWAGASSRFAGLGSAMNNKSPGLRWTNFTGKEENQSVPLEGARTIAQAQFNNAPR